MSDLTVVCVLWMGNFRHRRYNPDWVWRLRNMVARNLTIPHNFVCLSNVDVPDIETIPLITDLPGWWAKVELFRPGLFQGRVLYLDLDSLIVGSLDEMVTYPGGYVPCPHSSTWKGEGVDTRSGVVLHTCSHCLVWDAGEAEEIWTEFRPKHMEQFRGDQDWMGKVMNHADTLPPHWFLKLRQCPDGPPAGVKVVACMPWKNDEAAQLFDWVQELWQ